MNFAAALLAAGLFAASEEVHMEQLPEVPEAVRAHWPSAWVEDGQDVREVGKGQYGKVYIVIPKRGAGDLHAVKEMHKLQDEGFERAQLEIEFMKMFDHPNIIKYQGSSVSGTSVFIRMEAAIGGNLDMVAKSSLDLKEKGRLFVEALAGIDQIHKTGLIHRDLKPENVLVSVGKDGKNHAVVADLGLACCYTQEAVAKVRGDLQDVALPTTIAGSDLYMPPELYRFEDGEPGYESVWTGIRPQGDVWALGLILYQLVQGGSLPASYSRMRPDDVKRFRVQEDPAFSGFDPQLQELLLNLMNPDPNNRFSAEQALNAAEEWLKSLDQPRPARRAEMMSQFYSG